MKHILVLATVALCSPTIACARGVSGAWKFEATGARGGASIMTCTLTRSGNALAGSCVTQRGSTVDVSGIVTGDDVEFGYIVTGSPLHVEFKGLIQSDGSSRGTVTAAVPPVPFIGTRQ